jgi:hypothetical protein
MIDNGQFNFSAGNSTPLLVDVVKIVPMAFGMVLSPCGGWAREIDDRPNLDGLSFANGH